MKPKIKRLVDGLILLGFLVATLAYPSTSEAATFVVNVVDDIYDGACDSVHCSLRDALSEAGMNPGPDTITFNIPGPGPHSIVLGRGLFIVDDHTTIDGTTQPSYNGSPLIVLEGDGSHNVGLTINSSHNVVRGLSFVRMSWLNRAIFTAPGTSSMATNNLIEGNHFGFDPLDPQAGNFEGVNLNSPDNIVRGNFFFGNYIAIRVLVGGQVIENNVISGNYIGINAEEGNLLIRGNLIGTDPTGMTTQPNFGNVNGISLRTSEQVLIGGTDPADANLISGNDRGIDTSNSNHIIQGNLIGTNITGDAKLPNETGIWIRVGESNLIGGTDPGAGNLISGNNYGIVLVGSNNVVQGNKIGTTLAGDAPLGNTIGIFERGINDQIGGADSAASNLISGNEYGLALRGDAEGNWIEGNKFGTDLDGAVDIGNDVAIHILGSSNAILNNLIAYSHTSGIEFYGGIKNSIVENLIHSNGRGILLTWGCMADPQSNKISRNSIYDNVELGIDIQPSGDPFGVTPNDPGDLDAGPNDVLNFPVLHVDTPAIFGEVCPGCSVELFVSDEDPSGHGEGKSFIDSITADANGNFSYVFSHSPLECHRFTATATDLTGNTSEFSDDVKYGLCLTLSPILAMLIGLLPIILGLTAGNVFGHFSRFPVNTATVVGSLVGILGSAGFLGLALVLPGIRIELPQARQAASIDTIPDCSQFLDSSGYAPPEDVVFEEGENPDLAWTPSNDLPEGFIQWTVELRRSGETGISRTTSDTTLKFTAFDLFPDPGDVYFWRVVGKVATSADAPLQPLCRSVAWRSFQIGAPPLEVPIPLPPEPSPEPTISPTPTVTATATPTPTAEECLYTALQNANCRASDYVESAQIAVLLQGASAELIALNPEFTHGKFELQSLQQCWIWLGLLDGPPNPYGTCGVPVVDPPPRPTDTPTPIACRSDMGKEACEASGGEWSGEVVGATGCVCPE